MKTNHYIIHGVACELTCGEHNEVIEKLMGLEVEIEDLMKPKMRAWEFFRLSSRLISEVIAKRTPEPVLKERDEPPDFLALWTICQACQGSGYADDSGKTNCHSCKGCGREPLAEGHRILELVRNHFRPEPVATQWRRVTETEPGLECDAILLTSRVAWQGQRTRRGWAFMDFHGELHRMPYTPTHYMPLPAKPEDANMKTPREAAEDVRAKFDPLECLSMQLIERIIVDARAEMAEAAAKLVDAQSTAASVRPLLGYALYDVSRQIRELGGKQ